MKSIEKNHLASFYKAAIRNFNHVRKAHGYKSMAGALNDVENWSPSMQTYFKTLADKQKALADILK